MIGTMLLAVSVTVKLATFTGYVSKFAATEKLSQKFEVVSSNDPETKEYLAWVNCQSGICTVGIRENRLSSFSRNTLEYLAAHEICHVLHHDADGDLWEQMTPAKRDERHLHVDVCVTKLIGSQALVRYLFDYGVDDQHIDRYLEKLRAMIYRRYSRK